MQLFNKPVKDYDWYILLDAVANNIAALYGLFVLSVTITMIQMILGKNK